MRISVQLRPWLILEPPPSLPTVLAEAKLAGFEGVEVGAHYLDWHNPQTFRTLLNQFNLTLSGVHVGGDIFNPDNVRRVRAAVGQVADCVARLEAPFILFSGLLLDSHTPADLESEAQAIQQAAQLCAQRGLRLLYHNHWWEIENDYAYLRYYLAHTDPVLVSFCLDLGWVYRAGGDPLVAVDLVGQRGVYYHLRDDTRQKIWKGLGEGDIDLISVLKKLESMHPAWVAIEQDDISGSIVAAVGSSRRYLREKMNW